MDDDFKVVLHELIQSSSNAGYSSGYNDGLRYALNNMKVGWKDNYKPPNVDDWFKESKE